MALNKAHLKEHGPVDDNDHGCHKHVLCRNFWKSDHQSVGDGASQTAIGQNELVDLKLALVD